MSLDGIRVAEIYPSTTQISPINVGPNILNNMEKVANDAQHITVENSPEFLRSKIENHKLLNDVFFVNERGEIEVKVASESKILSNHFKGLPVVPGVILRTLFEEITGKNEISSKSEFKCMVMPGNKLKVTENGIANLDGKEIFAYSNGELNPEEITIPGDGKQESLSKKDADRLILQSGAFRFADEVQVYRNDTPSKEIEVGSVISGSFLVPENFEFLDKNGGVQKSIYDEIAAQILSLGASYILNGEIPNDDRKFKILTFGESNIRKISGESILPGSKIECIAKVTSADSKLAAVQFELYSNGKPVLEGEIKGKIIPKAFLSRAQRGN